MDVVAAHEARDAALESRLRREATVADLGTRALREEDLAALASYAAARVAGEMGADLCAVHEVRLGRLVQLGAHGLGAERGVPVPPEDPAVAAIAAGEAMAWADLAADARFARAPVVALHGARSGAAIVIHGSFGVDGVVAAYSTEGRTFSVDDLHFLRSVAAVLGAALAKRHSDEALRESEERFRLLVASVQDYAIFMLDPDGKVASWNLGAERIKGWRAEEIVGRHFSTFYGAEDLASGKPWRELEVATREGRFEDEGWRIRKDGSRFWANVVITPLRGPDGSVRGFAKVTRDFTARRAYEEGARRLAAETAAREAAQATAAQLRDSESRERRQAAQLAAILAAVGDGITLQDRTGAIVYANDAAARSCGFAGAAELVAATPAEVLARFEVADEAGRLVAPRDLPGRRVLAGDAPAPQVVRVREKATGREFWSQVSAAPVVDAADGRPVFAVNVWHDVTDRRRAEEASRFLADAAAVLNADLDPRRSLDRLARLSVPRVADWCAVDVLEGGRLVRHGVAHVDPAKVELARELERRYPADLEASRGVPAVIRTGRPELHPELPDRMLAEAMADDPEKLAAFRALGLRSVMIVPLAGRGGTIGAITFIMAESGRRFGPADLEVAVQLGRHAGLALENARLYASERAARASTERSFEQIARAQRLAAALAGALTPADVAGVVVDETVRALDARSAACWIVGDDGAAVLLRASGAEEAEQAGRVPLAGGAPSPVADAIRTGRAAWFESPEAFAATYPRDSSPERAGRRRAAFLPLTWGGRALGAVSYAFDGARPFEDDERAFLHLLASQCAQAFDRAGLYQQAVEAVTVRDDFLSIAGHELKTPLTALLFQAEALARGAGRLGADEVERRARRLSAQGERLGRLVDELLDVSRISAGRLVLEREDVDLAAVVREIALHAADEVARSGSDLRIDADGPVFGRWDRARVEQVAGNLLANALKYGRGTPIHVTVARDGAVGRLVVRDHGVGIAPADQARIFDRFERAVSARHFGGLGLGLWIVRQVVEAHGGRIQVESAPGRGAAFTVELPLGEGKLR